MLRVPGDTHSFFSAQRCQPGLCYGLSLPNPVPRSPMGIPDVITVTCREAHREGLV